MERKRGVIIGAVIAVVISIISIGIAFAAFSRDLTINGTAEVKGSSWDIHFATTQGGDEPASGGVTITPTSVVGLAESTSAVLQGSNFTWTGVFQAPGDTLEYRFYAVNDGVFDAVITGTFTSQVSCFINNIQQGTCPINYTITKDGTTPFVQNETLSKNTSQQIVVKAELDPSFQGTEETITVNTTQVIFTFNQKTN